MDLVVLQRCGLDALGCEDVDGPFLLPDGRLGLLLSLRGEHGGAMPSPAEIAWRRDLPPLAKSAPVRVFHRDGGTATYLGAATVQKKGPPRPDGFRVVLRLEEALAPEAWKRLVERANEPPPPAPEEALAQLPKNATAASRLDALRIFASRWFGVAADAPERPLAGVPLPLRVLHGLVDARAVCRQDRFVPAEELRLDDDGKLVFFVENQGVYAWATDDDADDPPVSRRLREHGAPWVHESDSLAAFVAQALVREAIWGAPFDARHEALDARRLSRLAKRVPLLPLPPWRASRERFYGGGGVIGFASPNGPEFTVHLGARDRAALESLEDLVADWGDR